MIQTVVVYSVITPIYFISIRFTYLRLTRPCGEDMSKIIAALLIFMVMGAIGTSMAATEVVVSGSTTLGPWGVLAADSFNSAQKDYHASVAQTGTGAGVTAIAQGNADVAMASREITADEKKQYGDKFKETLVGYDGVCICVSKAIYDAGVHNLTKAQVKSIYSGKVKNWKELGGPDELIYAIAREQGSGTRDNFNTDIMGSTTAETPGVNTVATGSSEVKTAITGSNKAIGYIGFSYSQSGNLGVLTIDGVTPTQDTIKSKKYPLARGLYLDTFGNVKPGAQAFIDFMLSAQGQKVGQDNGYVTL